jgi:hypothetical protein
VLAYSVTKEKKFFNNELRTNIIFDPSKKTWYIVRHFSLEKSGSFVVGSITDTEFYPVGVKNWNLKTGLNVIDHSTSSLTPWLNKLEHRQIREY